MTDIGQLEFDFARQVAPAADDGLTQWRAEMRQQDEAEARRLGLPLRRAVELQLENGSVVSGRLEFASPELLRLNRRPARLSLRIGNTVFDHSQITRCVVLD